MPTIRTVPMIDDGAMMPFDDADFDTLLTFGAIDPETGMQVGSVGAVATELLNFLLVALALFLVVKAYNRMKRSTPART